MTFDLFIIFREFYQLFLFALSTKLLITVFNSFPLSRLSAILGVSYSTLLSPSPHNVYYITDAASKSPYVAQRIATMC